MLYLEEYLDTIEGLPMELQRQFTLMRELDALSQELQNKMQTDISGYLDSITSMTREERATKLQDFMQLFSNALKHGEEKVALATQTYELVDKHIRKLDEDLARFEERQLTMPPRIAHSWGPGATNMAVDKDSGDIISNSNNNNNNNNDNNGGSKTSSGGGGGGGSTSKKRRNARSTSPNTSGKASSGHGQPGGGSGGSRHGQGHKKEGGGTSSSKGKGSKSTATTQILGDMPIDPNEPRYCYCNQVSYGEMVACDDDNCEVEWFHLGCVDLKAPPKGKWYCKRCLSNRKKKKDNGDK